MMVYVNSEFPVVIDSNDKDEEILLGSSNIRMIPIRGSVIDIIGETDNKFGAINFIPYVREIL